jgi:hypothetical protein
MRDYKAKTPLEVLLGHKDAETRLITSVQVEWGQHWHRALRSGDVLGTGPGIAAYGDKLATAACNSSDPSGRSDTAMVARMDRIGPARAAALRMAREAAQAVNAKFGKDKFGTARATWLASYLDGDWNPTNEAKRHHRKPHTIRLLLAEAIGEIAEFYINYRKENE